MNEKKKKEKEMQTETWTSSEEKNVFIADIDMISTNDVSMVFIEEASSIVLIKTRNDKKKGKEKRKKKKKTLFLIAVTRCLKFFEEQQIAYWLVRMQKKNVKQRIESGMSFLTV